VAGELKKQCFQEKGYYCSMKRGRHGGKNRKESTKEINLHFPNLCIALCWINTNQEERMKAAETSVLSA